MKWNAINLIQNRKNGSSSLPHLCSCHFCQSDSPLINHTNSVLAHEPAASLTDWSDNEVKASTIWFLFRKHRMTLRQINMCDDKQVSKDAALDPLTVIHFITFVRQLIQPLFTWINCMTENWSFRHLLRRGISYNPQSDFRWVMWKLQESTVRRVVVIALARARDVLHSGKDDTFGCTMIYWCYSLSISWCKIVILRSCLWL